MKCDFFKSLLLHWSYNFLELRLQPHLLHLLSSTTLGIKWYWYTPYPYQPTVATDGPRWWWRKLREIDASLLYLVLQNQAFQHVTVFFATAPSSQLAPQPAPRVPNIPRRKIFRMRSHVFDELLTQAPPPPPTSQDLFNSWETAVPRTLGIQRIFFNAKSDPIPIPSLVQQHSEHGPRKMVRILCISSSIGKYASSIVSMYAIRHQSHQRLFFGRVWHISFVQTMNNLHL